MCGAAFAITSSTSWRMRWRSSLYWHSTEFLEARLLTLYWLLLTLYWLSTNFYELLLTFYWLLLTLYWLSTYSTDSTDIQLTSVLTLYWLLRISTGFLLNSTVSILTLYWLFTGFYWLPTDTLLTFFWLQPTSTGFPPHRHNAQSSPIHCESQSYMSSFPRRILFQAHLLQRGGMALCAAAYFGSTSMCRLVHSSVILIHFIYNVYVSVYYILHLTSMCRLVHSSVIFIR